MRILSYILIFWLICAAIASVYLGFNVSKVKKSIEIFISSKSIINKIIK